MDTIEKGVYTPFSMMDTEKRFIQWSIEEILDKQLIGIEKLHQTITMLSACHDNYKNIALAKNKIEAISSKFSTLLTLYEEQKYLLKQFELVQDRVVFLTKLIDKIAERIELKERYLKIPNGIADVTDTSEESKLSELSSPNSGGFSRNTVVNIQPVKLFLDLAYVTPNEFSSVPKYMAGRLTCDAMNMFIDKINAAFSNKYGLLAKPKSALKQSELVLYKHYRDLQCGPYKKKHFVEEKDITAEMHLKNLDKKSLNLIVILRHLKKISENKHPRGVKIYMAV